MTTAVNQLEAHDSLAGRKKPTPPYSFIASAVTTQQERREHACKKKDYLPTHSIYASAETIRQERRNNNLSWVKSAEAISSKCPRLDLLSVPPYSFLRPGTCDTAYVTPAKARLSTDNSRHCTNQWKPICLIVCDDV